MLRFFILGMLLAVCGAIVISSSQTETGVILSEFSGSLDVPSVLNWLMREWRKVLFTVGILFFHSLFSGQMWSKMAHSDNIKKIHEQHPTLGNFTNLKYIGYAAINQNQFKRQFKWYLIKMGLCIWLLYLILWENSFLKNPI